MRLNSMSSATSSSVTLPLPLYSVPDRSSRLWSTRGRIGRIRYCSRLAAVGLIYNLTLFVPLYLDHLYPATLTQSTFTILIYAYASLYSVFSLFAILQAKRRLNDQGRSGWALLIGLIPLINVWLVISLIFFRGTPGSNPFGPPPSPSTSSETKHFWCFLILNIAVASAAICYGPLQFHLDL
ncbi:DUF805 domain-containing protein [Halomonas sp. DN3]|uniref:DUF805 domain-containing protein n=1 Tax=Halomonas sp. DN3 TaxID=2953657 RepID=UPI00345FFA2D